jgi:hypothetical protein
MATNQTNSGELKKLELACGITLDTTPNLKDFYCMGDRNHYAANLDMLVNGFNSIGHQWIVEAGDPYIITPGDTGTYVNFVKWLNANKILEACQKLTPAGQRGELVTGGLLGINLISTSMMTRNPITGPGQNTHNLTVNALNSIDPNMVTKIENVCNIIRTRSYLSLPAAGFGSLQSLLYKAQGAVQGLAQYLYNIYHGVLAMMQKFARMINGIIQSLNQIIYDYINQHILPLDLICAILGAFQSLVDDVAFFAQLFDGGDAVFNAINAVQTGINYAVQGLNYIANPISLAGLIPGINDVFTALNELSSDPEAFMGHLITHFNLTAGQNNKAIQIANAILLRYGLEGQLGPLGPLLLSQGVAGNSSDWYKTGNTGTGNFGNLATGNVTPNQGYFDPDNPLEFLDVNSNQYFNAAKTNLADFTDNAKAIPGAFSTFIANPLK